MTGLFLLLSLQSTPDSLSPPGMVAGIVTDQSHRPIQRAIVELAPGSCETKTDQHGRFEFKNLDPKAYVLNVRALGYQRQVVQVMLDSTAGSWKRLPLAMVAQLLPEVAVRVNEWKPAEYAPTTKYDGFFERQRKGSGTFFDRDEIDRIMPSHITQIFQLAPGFHVRYQPAGSTGNMATTVRVTRCEGNPPAMAIYVDGQRLRWGGSPVARPSEEFAEILDAINPRDVEMVEVYRGASQIPAEFGRDVCAVVAIWTRWNQ
jgi:hypothetical protein